MRGPVYCARPPPRPQAPVLSSRPLPSRREEAAIADDRFLSAAAADLAAVIERAGADLALAEEPAGFVLALQAASTTDRAQE
jgi:hypothetical protein